VRLEALGALPLSLLLQAHPPLVQHVVHPLLEGGLLVLQRLLALGQVGGGLANHALPSLEGFPLPVEPVLEGGELLLLVAQPLFVAVGLFLRCGEPCLEQA
jgi:hypothetical protein